MDSDGTDSEIEEIRNWAEMSRYEDIMRGEIEWCLGQVGQAYQQEPARTQKGEENRADMIWLASVAVALLWPGQVRTRLRDMWHGHLRSRPPSSDFEVACEHLFMVAAHNLGVDDHVGPEELREMEDQKDISASVGGDADPRDAMVVLMDEGILCHAREACGLVTTVSPGWLAEEYRRSVRRFPASTYRLSVHPHTAEVPLEDAQRAYFLMHYPLLVLNIGLEPGAEVDVPFLAPIVADWFQFLTATEARWTRNYELLAEVSLTLLLLERNVIARRTGASILPPGFEEKIFRMQRTLRERNGARSNVRVPGFSVYFFRNHSQSGTLRHQSYHTNVLMALLMANYLEWKRG